MCVNSASTGLRGGHWETGVPTAIQKTDLLLDRVIDQATGLWQAKPPAPQSLLAALIPAYRAARIHPAQALRFE